MGFLNLLKKMFKRKPIRDPELDPFTVIFTTDKNGDTEVRRVAVGWYNLYTECKDNRVYDILRIAGHKNTSNIPIIEGDNGRQLILLKAPTFSHFVEPNGKLSVEECREPGPDGGPEQKFRINVLLPQHMPATRFSKWWYAFFRAPQLKYSDYDIYLKPEEGVAGGEIKVQRGTIPPPAPGAGAPRLRIIDGRKGRSALDTAEMRTLIDMDSGWVRNHFSNKGYIISAVFTNEELRDVQPGNYQIMVKINYDNINQHISVGSIMFVEGHEVNIALEIVRLNPQNTNIIPADGITYAEYQVRATYLNTPNRRPHGLILHLETSHPVALTDTAGNPLPGGLAPGLGPRTAAGRTYTLPVYQGVSQTFRVTSGTAVEDLVLTAHMLGSDIAETHLIIGGYELHHEATQNTVVAGLGMGLQVRVRVRDPITGKPIRIPAGGPPPQVKFTINGDGELYNPTGGPGAPGAKTINIPVDTDGIAIVDVKPGLRAEQLSVIASMGERVSNPLTIHLTVVHPNIRIENVYNEYGHDVFQQHLPPTITGREPPAPPPHQGFRINNSNFFGLLGNKRYTFVARVFGPDGNVSIDGTPVIFQFNREDDIGRFYPHGNYNFFDADGHPIAPEAAQRNQVHVRTMGGLAKVDFIVETVDPRERFLAVYAFLPFADKKDHVIVPIVPALEDMDVEQEDIPGFDLPIITVDMDIE